MWQLAGASGTQSTTVGTHLHPSGVWLDALLCGQFDGRLLHGVLSGQRVDWQSQKSRRVTLMFGIWTGVGCTKSVGRGRGACLCDKKSCLCVSSCASDITDIVNLAS